MPQVVIINCILVQKVEGEREVYGLKLFEKRGAPHPWNICNVIMYMSHESLKLYQHSHSDKLHQDIPILTQVISCTDRQNSTRLIILMMLIHTYKHVQYLLV